MSEEEDWGHWNDWEPEWDFSEKEKGSVSLVVEEIAAKRGELLFLGPGDWNRVEMSNSIPSIWRRPLTGVDIRFVASGCSSRHCVALDVEGHCYTWGFNHMGQLGHGDKNSRDKPTLVTQLSRCKIVTAGTGKSHTVVVTQDGSSLSFGCNKYRQLGAGSVENVELSPVHCPLSDVKVATCGSEFTVWLTYQGSIMTAGNPQYGQLGRETDNEENTNDHSCPKAVHSLTDTMVKVACGANHTISVDSEGYVYTWGCGRYGRLGHGEEKNELYPRRIDFFSRELALPPDAVVSAGSVTSCVSAGPNLYTWGKWIDKEELWMKPILFGRVLNVHCMDSGSKFNLIGTSSSTLSWGYAQRGERVHGRDLQKLSARLTTKIDILEGMHVMSVACGFAHSVVVVDKTKVDDKLDRVAPCVVDDRLDQPDVHGEKAKAAGEGSEVKNECKFVSKTLKGKNKRKSGKRKKDNKGSEVVGQSSQQLGSELTKSD